MADELDKFTLQYAVEVRDALKNIERLSEAVTKVNKESSSSGKGMKKFASGAADELGKVVPGVDKVTAAVRLMGGQFAVAATAVAALGAGIKMAMDVRDQYNKQRQAGMDQGYSGVRVEDFQRKFARNSGGYVSNETAMAQLQKIRSAESEAYQDPQRMGQNARMFRLLGVDVGKLGQGSTPVPQLLSKMGERLQGMTTAQRQGWAQANGFDQNFVETMGKYGSKMGQITEMSPDEVKNYKSGDKSTQDFNKALSDTNEQFREMSNTIGKDLLPGLTSLVKMFGTLAKELPAAGKAGIDKLDPKKSNVAKEGLFMGSLHNFVRKIAGKDGGISWSDGLTGKLIDVFKPDENREKQKNPGKTEETKKKEEAEAAAKQKQAEKLAQKEDATNSKAAQVQDQFGLTMNMFSGAVATFANAVDEKQAWAAWAGEVGHAAGLGSKDGYNGAAGGQTSDGTHIDPTAPSKYDDFFKKASDKYGVPMDLLKRVTSVESKFKPRAVSEAGAQGLMQIMPDNFKSLGIKDGFDPEQNIMGGAKLLSGYMKQATSVREALMMYHGGYDRSGWGHRTYSYPGKVLGDAQIGDNYGSGTPRNGNQVLGQSRAKMQIRSVQETIAGRLGIPVSQLQQGDVNKGDVSWAVSQLKAGIQNQIQSLGVQSQAAMLPPMQRAKILNEQRDQESGLAQINKWGPMVEGGAQEGPRSITVGERAIVINVNGTTDPQATADRVKETLGNNWHDLANSTPTGVKR